MGAGQCLSGVSAYANWPTIYIGAVLAAVVTVILLITKRIAPGKLLPTSPWQKTLWSSDNEGGDGLDVTK